MLTLQEFLDNAKDIRGAMVLNYEIDSGYKEIMDMRPGIESGYIRDRKVVITLRLPDLNYSESTELTGGFE